MAKPEPQPGLVIRYDYLWADEARRGREEGAKHRPCGIVLVVRTSPDGRPSALVCPISHSPPREQGAALEIAAAVSRRLGLDQDRSWIVFDEVNLVDWSDPGIIPPQAPDWAYGFLPAGLTRNVIDRVRERIRSRRLKVVDRPWIEQVRDERESGKRDR